MHCSNIRKIIACRMTIKSRIGKDKAVLIIMLPKHPEH